MYVVSNVAREHAATVDVPGEICCLRIQSASLEREW